MIGKVGRVLDPSEPFYPLRQWCERVRDPLGFKTRARHQLPSNHNQNVCILDHPCWAQNTKYMEIGKYTFTFLTQVGILRWDPMGSEVETEKAEYNVI